MIRRTAKHLAHVAPIDQQWVITGAHLVDAIAEAVPELSRARIIAEPVGRNTAPCVGLAATLIALEHGDVPFGVFPSDHFIHGLDAWEACLNAAAEAARGDVIVTLGVPPTRPETGYGYICCAAEPDTLNLTAQPVERFVEKPDRATAERYLASGRYLWNAGIFVARTSVMLAEIARQMPVLHAALEVLGRAWRTPQWEQTLAEIYPTLPSTSVDYGVMEGARDVRVVPATFGWSDVGHWSALDETQPADEHGNVGIGATRFVDTRGSIAVSTTNTGKLIVTLGVDDLVIVDTEDALLVCPRARAQDVRIVVDLLKEEGLDALL